MFVRNSSDGLCLGEFTGVVCGAIGALVGGSVLLARLERHARQRATGTLARVESLMGIGALAASVAVGLLAALIAARVVHAVSG